MIDHTGFSSTGFITGERLSWRSPRAARAIPSRSAGVVIAIVRHHAVVDGLFQGALVASEYVMPAGTSCFPERR